MTTHENDVEGVGVYIIIEDLCLSYFCKIWALCVWQIYMVYIFACLFNIRNAIDLSRYEYV